MALMSCPSACRCGMSRKSTLGQRGISSGGIGSSPFGWLWGDLPAGHHIPGVGEARLHVIAGEVRMSSEKLGDIRVMGELFKHQVHGNTRAFDHRLARQNAWIRN